METEKYEEAISKIINSDKFDFDSFFYNWAEVHDISQQQIQFLYNLVRKIGCKFFHEALIEYMEESDNYEVDYDENVIYHERF